MSSNTSIHALKSLLIPNGQDTRCFLRRVNETVGQGNSAKTSAFCPQVWDPERLPLEAHLCGDLQTRMLDDLAAILDHSYSDQAAKTEFINPGVAISRPTMFSCYYENNVHVVLSSLVMKEEQRPFRNVFLT